MRRDRSRALLGAALLAFLLPACVARGAAVPPAPDPGLAGSIRAADAIVEVEILAGGPFRACAAVRRVYKGQLPKVIELEAYNSYNQDATHAGFLTGTQWILFLSRTGRADVFAPLTPSAPRLPLGEDGVLLTLGDPPFRIPIKPADMAEALTLALEREQSGAVPERAPAFLKDLWERNEIEPRYLAVALAGLLRDGRVVSLLAPSTKDELLRLRLTAVESLRRIGTPEALAALRPLLTDERESVARAAASALLDAQDLASLGPLLEWARRAAEGQAKLPAKDARRTKTAEALNQLLLLLVDAGPLLPPERVAPALLALARAPDDEPAKTALYVYDMLAGREQIPALVELAEDPVYAHRREAALALFRATLQPALDLDEFRAWWKAKGPAFGEEARAAAVKSAAMGFALGASDDNPGQQLGVLLSAPGELALPEVAPLLLRDRTSALFEARHLTAWRTPLTVPFLLERLTYSDDQERRAAYQGLVLLARRHARLKALLRPLLRAALADSDSTVRRLATVASGGLDDAGALPRLLDALSGAGGGGYEANEATKAVYELSARTLGHGYYELAEENEAAVRRLASWWEGLGPRRAAWTSPLAGPAARLGSGLAPAELEALCTGAASRPAGAAFGPLWEERGPGDPFWIRLLASARVRDQAHGALGLCGGEVGAIAPLAGLLESPARNGELAQVCALVALATLKGGRGPDRVAEWLNGAGAKAEPGARGIAWVSLGLAEGEPKSLACLTRGLEAALAAEGADGETGAEAARAQVELRAVVLALCARSDGTEALARALSARNESLRELAVRTLAMRRAHEATGAVLAAVSRVDRLTAYDLARAVAPLLRAEDGPRLAEMLNAGTDSPRLIAAIILSLRPELGASAQVRGALVTALQDTSSYVRARAAEALGKLRARSAIPSLALLLSDYALEVRTAGIEALTRIGDRESAAAASSEARRYTRVNPLWFRALGLNGSPEDTELLLKASKAESWVEQRAALEALGLTGRPEALARLLSVFRDPESPYQTHAGDALAGEGAGLSPMTARALAALAADFDSERSTVRVRALYWLARVPLEAGGEHLVRALADPDPNVRQLADWVLRRQTGQDAGFDPLAPPGQREAAAKRWKEIVAGTAQRR